MEKCRRSKEYENEMNRLKNKYFTFVDRILILARTTVDDLYDIVTLSLSRDTFSVEKRLSLVLSIGLSDTLLPFLV